MFLAYHRLSDCSSRKREEASKIERETESKTTPLKGLAKKYSLSCNRKQLTFKRRCERDLWPRPRRGGSTARLRRAALAKRPRRASGLIRLQWLTCVVVAAELRIRPTLPTLRTCSLKCFDVRKPTRSTESPSLNS